MDFLHPLNLSMDRILRLKTYVKNYSLFFQQFLILFFEKSTNVFI